jgi:hypothetical protein
MPKAPSKHAAYASAYVAAGYVEVRRWVRPEEARVIHDAADNHNDALFEIREQVRKEMEAKNDE